MATRDQGTGKDQSRGDDRSTDRLRRLIGWTGMWLPAVMLAAVLLFQGYEMYDKLDSISAYYYSCAISGFVGMLVTLAVFLFAYQGFQNEGNVADRWLCNIAGVMAIGVAAFPTSPPPSLQNYAPSFFQNWMGLAHIGFAVALFGLFAVISAWLFTKKHSNGFLGTLRDCLSSATEATTVEGAKRNRNRFHLLCACVIVGAIITAFGLRLWKGDTSIFIPEWIALIAFSASWLAKGNLRLRDAWKLGAPDVITVLAVDTGKAKRASTKQT